MEPVENIEAIIRKKLQARADATLHDRVLAQVRRAYQHDEHVTPALRGPVERRPIMKSPLARLAMTAVIVALAMGGVYILTGSVDGTSITIAQMRNAIQATDWMQMRNKTGPEIAWYAFLSKVQIAVGDDGEIIYLDFNSGKRQIWSPGSEVIYESLIDETKQSADGVSGPWGAINEFLNSLEKDGWDVTKELGNYDGRTTEVWTVSQESSTSLLRMYIDAERKLPVALVEETKGPGSTLRIQKDIVFDYPQTGPANIYEAGAPRSARIEAAPEE